MFLFTFDWGLVRLVGLANQWMGVKAWCWNTPITAVLGKHYGAGECPSMTHALLLN